MRVIFTLLMIFVVSGSLMGGVTLEVVKDPFRHLCSSRMERWRKGSLARFRSQR